MLSVLDTLSELPALREAVGAAPVASGDTLELAAELGRGSFGCVSGCSVAGRRGAPTAVKRFHDASGERNLRVVADLHRALADLGRDDLSRLRGVPYWAGHLTEGAGPPRPATVRWRTCWRTTTDGGACSACRCPTGCGWPPRSPTGAPCWTGSGSSTPT